MRRGTEYYYFNGAVTKMPLLNPAAVWPERSWSLSALSEEQWDSWMANGYLVVPDAVQQEVASEAAAAIREYVGANDNKTSWYTNVLDIYEDIVPNDGRKPHHGPCGMVQMFHHKTLWAIRQAPRVHQIFSDLYGTRRLFVTGDRAHFKPPQNAAHPAWSDPGPVHVGLHWDVDTRESHWPVPYVMQGVVYLEDTKAEQGALRVVPGFHRRLHDWSKEQPANRSAERPDGAAAEKLAALAVAVEGKSGSLVIWHSLLPHGPAPNTGSRPRVSAYVTMLPVDAGPFLGPRPSDAPLGMTDAGSLAYLPDLPLPDGYIPEVGARDDDGEQQGVGVQGTATSGEHSPAPPAPPQNGTPRCSTSSLRRQSRERRAERWRQRLPLLDEDPKESELCRRPPGEEDGTPTPLTPLGQRLVGLVEWEP